MKVFTYSEARQNFAEILKLAQIEEVEIRRRDGAAFSVTSKKKSASSPFGIVKLVYMIVHHSTSALEA